MTGRDVDVLHRSHRARCDEDEDQSGELQPPDAWPRAGDRVRVLSEIIQHPGIGLVFDEHEATVMARDGDVVVTAGGERREQFRWGSHVGGAFWLLDGDPDAFYVRTALFPPLRGVGDTRR